VAVKFKIEVRRNVIAFEGFKMQLPSGKELSRRRYAKAQRRRDVLLRAFRDYNEINFPFRP
jgi:hypothetical protein